MGGILAVVEERRVAGVVAGVLFFFCSGSRSTEVVCWDGGRVHSGGAVVRAAVVGGGRGVAKRSSRGGEGWVRVVVEDGESPELSPPLPMIYNSSSHGDNDGTEFVIQTCLKRFAFLARRIGKCEGKRKSTGNSRRKEQTNINLTDNHKRQKRILQYNPYIYERLLVQTQKYQLQQR